MYSNHFKEEITYKLTVSAIDVCSEALFTATENAIELNAEVDFLYSIFSTKKKWKELRTIRYHRQQSTLCKTKRDKHNA